MMKGYRFCIISLLIVFVLFSFVTIKVNGHGEQSIALERDFYEELEDSYTERLQDVLAAKGYRNAGITMTKVYQEDGSREYTVQIHHKRIERLEEGERILLLNELAAVSFQDTQCKVIHNFLDCDE